MIDLRTEYPRPQAVRADYLCLNGEWEFEIDNALVGVEKKYYERAHLDGKITVPYCPESVLSGVGHTDFMNGVWYRRDLEIPAEYAGRRIILHFGAVDHEAHIYLNGREVGSHMGGYTPFSIDVTDALVDGVNSLCVYARDDVRSRKQPAGKQCPRLDSYGCFYTRTTGIWQTVWLEPVAEGYISTFFTDTSISAPSVTLRVRTVNAIGQTLTVTTSYEGKPTGSAAVKVFSPVTTLTVPLTEAHLWEIGNGRLYDMTLSLSGGDSVAAYFGLREVSWDKKGMYINGKIFFGRYILDQSFFPDGIYTAPSDARLKQDILDSMAMGFNGARMHEKVFEPRYLYHADRLGYLVWGEFPNWVLDVTEYTSLDAYVKPWIESMERDYNHPSLIGWCPFNETWDHAGRKQCDAVLAAIYHITKAVDSSRPCIDTSGNFHVITDIYDIHDYNQDPVEYAAHYAVDENGKMPEKNGHPWFAERQRYDHSLPLFISEYGGIKWDVEEDNKAWGYGASVTTEEEFFARLKGLTDAMLDHPGICAFCYTQLTDVEQERNGLLTYDRRFKFDPARVREIIARRAKIEE